MLKICASASKKVHLEGVEFGSFGLMSSLELEVAGQATSKTIKKHIREARKLKAIDADQTPIKAIDAISKSINMDRNTLHAILYRE